MALEHFKTQVLLLHSQQSTLDALSAGFGDRYSVHVATSGAEALNTLGATPIHVIVSAQDLPGMSGLEALREARKRSPDTIGILLAGNDRDDGLEALVGDKEVFQIVRGAISPEGLRNLIDTATKRIRLLAISESANDQAADVDEPAGEHIVMETGEHGRPIISASSIPVLQPQNPPVSPNAGGREVDVLVLTKDEEFLETIKESSRGLHNVHYASSVGQAEAVVRQHKVGVLVTDAAIGGAGIESITERLRGAIPRLVAIVAGRRDDGELLMDLINRGQVYRFLLKPVSPGRARLAIEASVNHHLEAADSAFAPKTRGAAPAAKAPPRPAAKPAPPAARPARQQAAPPRPADPALRQSGRLGDSGARRAPVADSPPPAAPATESAASAPAAAEGGKGLPKAALLSAAALAVLLVAGGAAWLMLGSQEPKGPDTTRAAAATPAETVVQSSPSIVETDIPTAGPAAGTPPPWQATLEEARIARDVGELIAPPGSNAVELYLSARALAPAEPVIQSELDGVIEQVLTLAETALLDERAGDAADALAMVRLANPDHPRLPFLDAQVRQRVLRVRLGEARIAIREGRFEDAAGALTAAKALAGTETDELKLLQEELATARSEQQVDQVLARANQRLTDNRLVAPSNDNARYYYELVLSSDPGNTAARQGLVAVASKLVLGARTAIDEGRLDEAESLLADAREIDPRSGQLTGAVQALASQFVIRAAAAVDESRFDDAEALLDKARALDPANADLSATAEALASARATAAEAERQAELAARADTDAAAGAAPGAGASVPAAGDAAGATAFVPTGTDAMPGAERSAAAPAEPAQPEYVPISSLTRTNYVVPEYPRTAQRRNLTGWVDLTFIVTPQGRVEDVGILDAEPGNVFEEAAIQAIRQWRFEPPMENGVPVARRVAVRLSFDLQ